MLAAETTLGRLPQKMPYKRPRLSHPLHNRGRAPGVHRSQRPGHRRRRVLVTKSKALTDKNAATGCRLALVSIHPDGPQCDEVCRIVGPFRDVDFGDFTATGMSGHWAKEWARGLNLV